MVDCAFDPSAAREVVASEQLGGVQSAYTVYLDLWLLRLDGIVIANGRPDRFNVRGHNVAHESRSGELYRELASGDDYSAGDVTEQPMLDGAQVATYCALVCEGGRAQGHPLGVMVVHFDWEPQAQAIMAGFGYRRKSVSAPGCPS